MPEPSHYRAFNFMHRSQIQQTECRSGAIIGGSGGKFFVEDPSNCGAIVKKIKIRFESRVYGIQITYQLPNGQEYTGRFHGGTTGGIQLTANIDVNRGERIIGVYGRYDSQGINLLGFYTSKGYHYGPYGGCTGDFLNIYACNVRGIHGFASSKLDAIGFLCTDI